MKKHLVTKDFILRDADYSDTNRLFEITQDKEVMEYYGMLPFTEIDDAKEEIEWFINLSKEKNGFRWVIANLENEYIGDVGLFNFDKTHNRIELGYKLNKSYWKKGIMTRSIKKVIDYGFSNLKYNRIEAMVEPENIGSHKVLKKCGFIKEGVLREFEQVGGKYVDLEIYSILKREYIRD